MWEAVEDRLSTPVLQAGFGYWRGLIDAGRDLPRIERFDPSAIPRLLPSIVLIEVREPPLDFRYRVIGQDILNHLFENYTGRWVSQIPHQAEPGPFLDTLTRAVRECTPQVADSPYIGPKRDFMQKGEVVLPLIDEAGTVCRLLIFIEFTLKPGRSRPLL